MGKPNKEKKKPVPAPRKTAACGKGLKDYPYENMPPVFVDDSVVEPDAKNNPDGAKFKKRPPKKEVLVYDTPRPIVHKVEPKAQAANPVARPSATGANAVHEAVPLAQFEDYIHKKKKRTYRDGNGFLKDYEDLPAPVKHACSVGKKRANKEKNRYANILPYDDTRVVLEKLPNKPNSDYVNASYIDGFDEPRKYIATQGPTKVSVDDMWRMVWQENVSKIVMLTNLRDGVKEKCDKYWPDDTTTYGNITVRLMNEVEHNGYIVREFTLAIKSQKRLRQVCQFHFTAWPGDGLPKESAKLIEFIKAVREFRPDGAGPMVVHCSTGTGRTGLFIVLDAMLDQVEKEGRVDIWNFTRSMRDKRIGVIQSALHYEFIFDTLLNTLKCAETTVKSA
ncbi:receptor-type tyrosine-protein phosphatase kappa-like [Acanthaster planci]|uniref:protein-tyrosine-phosphatase n=1 Tax=Acanthaster planci TaxID=133434 RepID=A0A8B7YL10_ACAPL|nr:receptor-type tyrosine-protein phosphatase kappa-like [Acanthaster planci]